MGNNDKQNKPPKKMWINTLDICACGIILNKLPTKKSFQSLPSDAISQANDIYIIVNVVFFVVYFLDAITHHKVCDSRWFCFSFSQFWYQNQFQLFRKQVANAFRFLQHCTCCEKLNNNMIYCDLMRFDAIWCDLMRSRVESGRVHSQKLSSRVGSWLMKFSSPWDHCSF